MSHRAPTHRQGGQRALLSVVLPVYNEAKVLPLLLQRIAAALSTCDLDHEIILVNDGSSDASPRVLDQLAAANARVRVVHFARNFGHQAAVQAGLAHARGDAVVLMDSDLQDAPEAIPRFVRKWREGYDVVYALRTQRKEKLVKRFLFAAFHRLLASIASVRIPRDAGIFGLVDRRVAAGLGPVGCVVLQVASVVEAENVSDDRDENSVSTPLPGLYVAGRRADILAVIPGVEVVATERQ